MRDNGPVRSAADRGRSAASSARVGTCDEALSDEALPDDLVLLRNMVVAVSAFEQRRAMSRGEESGDFFLIYSRRLSVLRHMQV